MQLEYYLPKAKKVYERKPALFETISPRQEKVLKMRLGIEPFEKAHTYEEIGERFAVTIEQARNLVTDALVHLGLNILADEENG